MDYRQEARRIASEFGIDPDLFVKLVQAESNFIPDNISDDGAVGLTQIMSNTALKPGYNVTPIENRLDPLDNLQKLNHSLFDLIVFVLLQLSLILVQLVPVKIVFVGLMIDMHLIDLI